MINQFKKEGYHVPVYSWCDPIEDSALKQLENIAKLPFAFHHVALMPDGHAGYGMPIGGVLATEGVIIPNAVGVDIGCGMAFMQTNIPITAFQKGTIIHEMINQIMRNVPTGFNKHSKRQEGSYIEDLFKYTESDIRELMLELNNVPYSLGTLGGGNHFIEIQEDEHGMACVMLHSGSRNLGYKIAKYFNDLATSINEKWLSSIPKEHELAFLPTDTQEGKDYIYWMNIALRFALENRLAMMNVVKEVIKKHFPEMEVRNMINAHHNYASLENHFGHNVWVHRKGAIRVREGQLGIIPSAMGSHSFIVEGLGNPQSFNSCSHGAGRRMGRKEASRQFTAQQTLEDLEQRGVILGKVKKGDVAEESVWAYKDIDTVINNELDLIKPVKRLQTVAVIKG